MSIDNSKVISLAGCFSKGFVHTESNSDLNLKYGSVTENFRISDGALINRSGYETVATFVDEGIVSMKAVGNQMLVVTNTRRVLLSTDSTVTNFTELGVLDDINGNGKITQCSISTFGEYYMFFYGAENSKVYDRILNTFTTIPYLGNVNIGGTDQDYKPKVSIVFTNRLWLAHNDYTKGVYSIMGGKPVGSLFKTGEPSNDNYITSDIYNFNVVNQRGVWITQSPVVGFASTLKKMYVFCQNEIYEFSNEYADLNTTDTSGKITKNPSPTAPLLHKIYEGPGPINSNSIVVVNDKIFFMAMDKQIRTISYPIGYPLSIVGEMSEGDYNIQYYLQNVLKDEQVEAFGLFYGKEKLIKFNVLTNGNSWNDTVLIFDIDNKTWLLDKGKSFTCGEELLGECFTGSQHNNKIWKDETGVVDSGPTGENITNKRRSKRFNFGTEDRKALREFCIYGKIDLNSKFTINLYCDGELVKSEQITSAIVNNSVAGLKTVNKLYNFKRIFSRGELYEKFHGFEFEIISTGHNQNFLLEGASATVVSLNFGEKNELTEK